MEEKTKKPDSVSGADASVKPISATPETHAANEDVHETTNPDKILPWYKRLSRKQTIIISISVGLILSSGLVFALTRPEPAPPPEPVVIERAEPEPAPPPEPIYSPLTGVEVTKKQQAMPVTAVMIENSPDARPQSGLQQAGVVYEAIAEGGITRFLALFQESEPEHIGPVRSLRPYYLDFLVPFDAPVAHVGGSPQALAEVRAQKIRDLDQFSNPGAYQRVSTRYAPHNMYTSRSQLLQLHKQKGFMSSKFKSFARKESNPRTSKTKNKASKIDLNISSYTYNSSFSYDKKTNSYLRTMAGHPHVDEKTGKRIKPKVVIVPIMDHHYNGIYSVYANSGKGKVYIFQDGKIQTGTWKKSGRKGQLKLLNAKGKDIKLNAGQKWITLADNKSQVVVTP